MLEKENLVPEDTNVSELVNEVVPELVNPVVPELPDEVIEDLIEEEVVELTEEELKEKEREEYIQLLKDSKKVFKPIKHKGNVTTNQFGSNYKKKRRNKNKATRKSRKANR